MSEQDLKRDLKGLRERVAALETRVAALENLLVAKCRCGQPATRCFTCVHPMQGTRQELCCATCEPSDLYRDGREKHELAA